MIMDAQWAYTHFLKSKRIKIITTKCLHFYSISSKMLVEFNHINAGFYSEFWKKSFVNFSSIAVINSVY